MIWTSIVSGKSPEKHGVHRFITRADSVKCKCLWEILTLQGFRCGIYGHLLAWPPPPLDCFSVPGFLALGPETIPPELSFVNKLALEVKTTRRGNLATYLRYGFQGLRHGLSPATLLKAARTQAIGAVGRRDHLRDFSNKRMLGLEIHSDVFARIFQQTRPDFALFYTNIVDACSHVFWKFMEPGSFRDVTQEN